ncbi:MAG: leucyl/phenylalanyl-tRNA--protein transferase [Flavobacterium sp.]|nr:leucyl/phenylalanyl-tRNA--protein transferase [Flavobacterium sp.]
MKFLTQDLIFPNVNSADKSGVLAFGGDLSTERLILAYKSGVFPWFNIDEPIVWWAPNPRMVLFLDELIVSKSMKNVIKKNTFTATFNQNFKEVISNCQQISRSGQNGTWLTNDMITAYCKLHEMGMAKSIEVWQNNQLVGGLYGIDLGHVFCGESMFSIVSNASKFAFISLVNDLKSQNYQLLDCQVHNDHLESLGCREIPRNDFMKILKNKTKN